MNINVFLTSSWLPCVPCLPRVPSALPAKLNTVSIVKTVTRPPGAGRGRLPSHTPRQKVGCWELMAVTPLLSSVTVTRLRFSARWCYGQKQFQSLSEVFTKYVVTEQENNDKFNEFRVEPQMEQRWTGGFMILSAIQRPADCCSILNVTYYPLLIANYLQH